MTTLSEIIKLIEDFSGTESVTPDMDIFGELGIVGDDFSELIEEYTEHYNLDMSNYIWYFHHDEEGFNLGAFFFKPPYKRVERIPITPSILAKSVKAKKWIIEYPNHEISEKRYDIILMQLLSVFAFTFFCVTWLCTYIFLD